MTSQFSLEELGIIGDSEPMHALARAIETSARSGLTTLITGESGTGKELVARAIHQQSSRADLPFISINCGALNETLLESELFGYERGAFTGANQNKKGLFQAAHTGTIFLDEIGEMSPACQVKLLRVLQENAVRPIGGHAEMPIDVHVIAATNRNLVQEVGAGRFREDLLYRITVLSIETPPLRKRTSDIPLLVEHFLRQADERMNHAQPHTMEDDALVALCAYPWPGNVRQLCHIIERLVATATDTEPITATAVLAALTVITPSDSGHQSTLGVNESDSLDEHLARRLLQVYDALRLQTGSHTRTAEILRIDRVSLYQRLGRAREILKACSSS